MRESRGKRIVLALLVLVLLSSYLYLEIAGAQSLPLPEKVTAPVQSEASAAAPGQVPAAQEGQNPAAPEQSAAPAPQPEPIPESVKQRFPLSAAKITIPMGEDEEPTPKPEERPMAFRPAEEAQTAPAGISIDVQWDDYWADHDGDGEPEARDACFKMVQTGEAKDMQEAKAKWLAQAQAMDTEQF